MKFDDAREVEQLAYQIRLADYPRGLNRARIDELFNGWPPFSEEEVEKNHAAVNVNFLESTRLGHDARSQFSNAFLKMGNFFTLRTDMGPASKRAQYGATVTSLINRFMKKSPDYFECFRSKFALDVMHGIGPSIWRDQDHWCPESVGICDVGIPARTYLTMRNLPFFYLYRSFTGPELMRETRKEKRDPAWNMPLVNSVLEWLDRETSELMGSNWPEVWAPERASERIKGDGGFFVGDQVPTVDCFDFYFYSDEGKNSGWRRRIILDSWSTPQTSGSSYTMTRKEGKIYDSKANQWLYNGKTRKYADKRENIIAFQFADLSAVAPFQYHSVRSLGFLIYALCHLQNRLRCAFTEAVFENLLQMFRVKSMEDVERAIRLKIHNFSFIDDTITPVPANERFQPNLNLVELGLSQNAQLIQEHSSSWVQNQNFSRDRTEKTKFQVMAEVNAMTTLVSAGLNQSYQYQNFENYEVVRRFMKRNSSDPDVNQFQAMARRRGVPEKMLVAGYWDCEPERVMGAGNKTLEMTIAQQLMEWRPLFNPSAQNDILKDAVIAITDDPARAAALVPDQPKVSDSIHDAELSFGTLMMGSWVTPKPGLNTVEVAGRIIQLMEQRVMLILKQGGVGTPQDVQGLMLCERYAQGFLKLLAQDEKSKPIVTRLEQMLSKVMNQVRAMDQRQQKMAQEQAKAQANGNGGMDPKDMAKMQATMMTAKQKVQQMRESHAARTAQRKLQFEQQLEQDRLRNQAELEHEAARTGLELASNRTSTMAEIQNNRLKSMNETGGEED